MFRCRGNSRGPKRARQSSSTFYSSCSSQVPSPTNSTSSLLTSSQSANNATGPSASMRRRVRSTRHRSSTTAAEVAVAAGSGAGNENGGGANEDSVDEEYGESMHNTVVLCSADDNFVLSQDMCVVCGSFGVGQEGRLVSCFQCGQCYHPYCVELKISKVVLRKGWRCLDCTVRRTCLRT